jgi:hypothetical protein
VGKRFYSCGVGRWRYHFTRIQNGVPVDVYWTKGFFYFKQDTSVNSVDSTVRVKTIEKVYAGTPQGVMNVTVLPSAQNSTGDVDISPGITTKPLASAPDTSFKFTENEVASGPGYLRKFDPTFGIGIISTAGVPVGPPYRDWHVPSVRCDSMTYLKGSGCVVRPDPQRSNVPTLDLTAGSGTNTLLWDHILHAQNSGLPGNPVRNQFRAPSPLTRITEGDAQYGRNRDLACPERRMSYYKPTQTPPLTCDEYPMAGTREGAAASYPNGGRTFSFCSMTTPLSGPPKGPPPAGPLYPDGDVPANMGLTGWSACFIPKPQNDSQGGLMPSFYRKNRILGYEEDLDGFMVSAYHS